jgi:hypothetical protein
MNSGDEYVVRFKTPTKHEVVCTDELRGVVRVSTDTIDDKILFKSDGMPTYHFAEFWCKLRFGATASRSRVQEKRILQERILRQLLPTA